jgi:hypothetical protein
MSEFSGKDLVCQWIHSGGTLTMDGDQRSVSFTPSVKTIRATAGSDADETYLVGPKDGTWSFAAVAQADGTATEDALVEGAIGTLIVGPEGTASGNRKYTCPAISMGPRYSWPFDEVCEYSCDFQKNGAVTRGTYD